MDNKEALRIYVQDWNAIKQERKPENQESFISLFLDFLIKCDNDNITFDGDGAYFGKQITIDNGMPYTNDPQLCFEVAYSKDKISIYTGNNNGFWYPEYVQITKDHSEFNRIFDVIKKKLITFIGID